MSARYIMIVEDEAECGSMLEVALEALPGIVVKRVGSVEAALGAMQHLRVAAVVSDVQLPGRSGLELIAEVRGAPVVIVSASADAGVREEAMRMGAAAFFTKPFSPASVCEAVRELLKESTNA